VLYRTDGLKGTNGIGKASNRPNRSLHASSLIGFFRDGTFQFSKSVARTESCISHSGPCQVTQLY